MLSDARDSEVVRVGGTVVLTGPSVLSYLPYSFRTTLHLYYKKNTNKTKSPYCTNNVIRIIVVPLVMQCDPEKSPHINTTGKGYKKYTQKIMMYYDARSTHAQRLDVGDGTVGCTTSTRVENYRVPDVCTARARAWAWMRMGRWVSTPRTGLVQRCGATERRSIVPQSRKRHLLCVLFEVMKR